MVSSVSLKVEIVKVITDTYDKLDEPQKLIENMNQDPNEYKCTFLYKV